MSDQAQGLRNLIKHQGADQEKATRIITVTSGKGGVGKSNFTLNFALSLQKKRVQGAHFRRGYRTRQY